MAEYIERAKVAQFFEKNKQVMWHKDDIAATVSSKSIPVADVVEVVRCRDCKHFTEGMAIGMCKRIEDKPIIPMPYNAFCAFGERKEKDA